MASRPRPFPSLAHAAPYAPSCVTLLLVGSLLIGCGRSVTTGSEPGATSPASAPESLSSESAPETLEQAEAELEQARLTLAQVGGGLSAPAGAPAVAAAPSPQSSPATGSEKKRGAAADEAPPPPKASRAPSKAEESLGQAESEADASARDDDRCETTCKAYASLLRAKSAVCRLDAPGGARCARAEGIVRDATPQVQSCQCPS